MTPAPAADPRAEAERWLRAALAARLNPGGAAWLAAAEQRVREDAAAIAGLFPAVGRSIGRGPLEEGAAPDDLHAWTVDDAGRVVLVLALGDAAPAELPRLYRYGDAAERRGVLRSLGVVDVGAVGTELVGDALRTNDLRLVAAALGPHAVVHLEDEALAHAVLKCVFTGVPLAGVRGLAGRASPRMARILAGFVVERVAAGRAVTPEVWPLIDAHPPGEELAALEAERTSPVPERRAAAEAALAARRHARPPARHHTP